jgi:Terminase large subunit, T4likevirus-type, N-terminal
MSDSKHPSAVNMMRNLGLAPDPWQIQVLEGDHRRLLLNCCRQAGKSTVVSVLALAEALFYPGALVLLLSRSLRQSTELFRTVSEFYRRFGSPLCESLTSHELRLKHRSRIISLPCQPDTVRGFARVRMLVIDEAARVPDDLYRTVRPMLAVSEGRLICLSTPHGRRGFFYDAWTVGGDDWTRIRVPATDVPRIRAEFLAEERRELGNAYRQEYECSFESMEGLVYPDFARCVVGEGPTPLSPSGRGVGGEGSPPQATSVSPGKAAEGEGSPVAATQICPFFPPEKKSPATNPGREVTNEASVAGNNSPLSPPGRGSGGEGSPSVRVVDGKVIVPRGKKFGGIDFGYRNPFAAIWGVLDRDDVLWLTGEHYCCNQPLSYHAARIPRDVTWYADPSGAGEISELNCAGFVVRRGNNAIRPGIIAVSARIADGRLRILKDACPNLLREATLYRYDSEREARRAETPLGEHDHALDALRYLVSRLDAGKLARLLRRDALAAQGAQAPEPSPPKKRPWLSVYNERLWTRLYP